MAKTDLLKFGELLNSDAEFQEKFRKAAEAYDGERDEKSVFDNLLLPLAEEYGLSATYDEFKAFTDALTGESQGELSEDELAQIAGGKDTGSGYGLCAGIGAGDMFGLSGDPLSSAYACEAIGFATICVFVGGK